MHVDIRQISGQSRSKAHDFEELITQLLMRERSDVHAVDGAGGDEGIDIFIGPSLDGPIEVFQCKFLTGPLGRSQKRQIKESLQRVITRRNVSAYTLCLPKNLSVAERQWLEGLGRDSGQSIEIWDESAILARLLKHPDIQRAFFAAALAHLGRYSRSAQEPAMQRARAAIPPRSFYPDALARLMRDRLLIISGPPHLGKTTLGRKMALEIQEQYPTLDIVDIERNGFDAIETSSGVKGLVLLLHDPFDESEPSGTKWPLLNELKTHNFIVITCRNIDLSQSVARPRVEDSTLSDYIKQIKSNEYAQDEMDSIYRQYLKYTSPSLGANELSFLRRSDFVPIYRSRLQSPHAIAYFFESVLPRNAPSSFENLIDIASRCNTVDQAVRALFESCPPAQRIFLMLIAVLDGQYEKVHLRLIYDRWIRTASRQGSILEGSSFARCMDIFSDVLGEMYSYQSRYRDFKDIGVNFLHPTYREAIIQAISEMPLEQRRLYGCAKDLIHRQETIGQRDERAKYDLICAGMDIICSQWSSLEADILEEIDEWTKYGGDFADYIQSSYFFILRRLADQATQRVLDEANILLHDDLVERARPGMVAAAFAAAAVDPKRGLAILAASGDLAPSEASAHGFSQVLARQPDLARTLLQDAMRGPELISNALIMSSLRFLENSDFERFGIGILEEFLDESWSFKQSFMNLLFVPGVWEGRRELPPHFQSLLKAWMGSNDPKKYGFMITLWHHNATILDLGDDKWPDPLELFLGREIDRDCERSLMSLAERYVLESKNNFLRDKFMSLVEAWLKHHSKDPDAAKDWRRRLKRARR